MLMRSLNSYPDEVMQPQDEVVIHVMCAELWRGGEPIACASFSVTATHLK
jgi:hypothetical protein